ncbi:aminotransferase class I/II-fold pyridoxal phosphate-dependent enzyme [Synechococcus sp. A10-1-5-1]|uniref:aminotransferase class I/II-fold pyridoxal phosphate-dependent enzyme n=1 Tax=Synechococcus sp. A10-1-5-1 TaxID=2936507 RepID=UPI0020013D62|nr:aminotransferase class I/II-fold pyridoxal phosphate-dependent enzyme [Synechococcus sp. A10-1-5-1]UPM49786.1 aminotransferase class I/II-fold pyridoxal phosphate-dependent enzyme [Synechococcus sp. A10-1-5-1]
MDAADPLAPLAADLEALPPARRRSLRSLEPAGQAAFAGEARPLLDLASNDYLGLSRDPALQQAATAAIEAVGVGAGASRLISGTRPVHAELEQALGHWLGRERVLLYPSGFQANIAAVQALADRHTWVIADRLIHHSLLVGIQATGAKLRRFQHNNLADLKDQLDRARRDAPQRRLLVLSESLFSMEGSSPDVTALAQLCRTHGAALLLDEAHSLGILGQGGRGLGYGIPEISLISGTFGKAFGSGGAFLAGNATVGDWLLQHSGPFRYSTALAPPLVAAAAAGLRAIQEREPERQALLARAERWRDALEAAGWPRPLGSGPILPLVVGGDRRALALQEQLEQAGLLSVAIRPPTVPSGTARLRLVLRHDCPPGTLSRLIKALGRP